MHRTVRHVMEKLQPFSLLWPPGTQPLQTDTALDPQCVRDLGLESLLSALTEGGLGRHTIRQVFLVLCTNPAVIAYRQNMLEDLWCYPALTHCLEELLPDISALEAYRSAIDRRRSTLQAVTWRLGELEQADCGR